MMVFSQKKKKETFLVYGLSGERQKYISSPKWRQMHFCSFFKSACLKAKLFLVVSDHAFGKENIAVLMLCLQVIEQADPGFGVLVLMDRQCPGY